MAETKMIHEDEASGRVRELYQEIKKGLGIDFVPNMYKAMALKPDFLESSWKKIRSVMHQEGKLDTLTKEIIAVSVSAVMGCKY